MTFQLKGFQRLALAVASLLTFAVAAHAGTVQFGPTPYLEDNRPAIGDTPVDFFDFSHPDCVGWIEDFEMGIDPFLTFDAGEILGPNSTSGLPDSVTDSVDGDDGVVDGNGNGGHSYYVEGGNSLTITFGDTVRAAGLVFTDGDNQSTNIALEAFDPDGNSLGIINAGDLADLTYTGETAEDRFLGFTDDMIGIGSIMITMEGGQGLEIDHVHWQTECVPEPAAQLMSIFALLGLVGLRRRR